MVLLEQVVLWPLLIFTTFVSAAAVVAVAVVAAAVVAVAVVTMVVSEGWMSEETLIFSSGLVVVVVGKAFTSVGIVAA